MKRIWYLSPMRAAKVQASLRIRTVSPEPPLLAHTSSESRGTFRQKARSLAPLNGWACAVKICHGGMLEDTNSLDGAPLVYYIFCCSMITQDISKTKRMDVLILEWVVDILMCATSRENLSSRGSDQISQTGLHSYRGYLESWKFEFNKYRHTV